MQTALGEAQLSDRCRQAVERSKTSGNVILGIRPEHFEDASLVGDKPGGTFDAPIDIVEAMGSDVYAYFVDEGRGGPLRRTSTTWPRTPATTCTATGCR